ncbi:carboxymuconolactone decarboxylase family protein [Microlunatus ginsengisoli]|uniref:Carboxymuconolactone decarboxylase-like domain-containing protein n=1 Tax=Microlunatus ginsengisoli TaxID=363863 RepID=A0ABP6ZQB3_9ACTN
MTGTIAGPGPGVELEARRRLARVPIDQPPGLFAKALGWFAGKLYGQVPDNGWAMAANRKVLLATLSHERKIARFDAVPEELKFLAEMATAMEIGCSWCVDFGYFAAHRKGADIEKLRAVADWRESDRFSELERRVIEFAIAATATPGEVSDELVEPLRTALGDAGLVELAMVVANENSRSRFNSALGLVSQGYSAVCRLP